MAGFIAAWLNVGVCCGIPFIILVFLFIKKRSYVSWFLLGVLGFLVSQVLTRLPILKLIQGTYGYFIFNANHPYITLFLLSISAAVFEESARYIIMYLYRGRNLDSRAAITYGVGHGGLEASLVGVNSLLLIFTKQNYLLHADWTIALGSLERISAMMVHVAFSILVYFAIADKKRIYYIYSIVLHTLYNSLLIFLFWGMPALVLELLLLVISFGLLYLFIYKIKRRKIL